MQTADLTLAGLLPSAILQDLLPFGYTEQRERPDIPIRLLTQCVQQRLPVSQQALDRAHLKEVRAILYPAVQPLRRLRDKQAQIKFGGPRSQRERREREGGV